MTDTVKYKYPIKVVAQKTGLNVHIIRMWERRYSAVLPTRTPTNRRLYSQADIDRLILLRRIVAAGYSIGQVALLPDDQIKLLLGDQPEQNIAPALPAVAPASFAVPEKDEQALAHAHLEDCFNEIQRFDSQGLDAALARASIALSQPALIDRVLVPLMDKIGQLWCTGKLRIVHERLASTIVRSFLGNFKSNRHLSVTVPRLLVTTPQGQYHELGALMAAVTAGAQGWHVTYLGPNLPAEEIAAGAKQNKARAVALSIIYPADDPLLAQELRKLRRLLGHEILLIVGGRAANNYDEVLREIAAVRMDSVAAFRSQLEALRLASAPGSGF